MSFSIALAVLKPYRCYIALALPMNVKQGPTNTSIVSLFSQSELTMKDKGHGCRFL